MDEFLRRSSCNEYQEATAFVFPSLNEGFGIRAIEAQKSCSRVSSRWGLANASRFSWKDSAQRVDLHITELQRH